MTRDLKKDLRHKTPVWAPFGSRVAIANLNAWRTSNPLPHSDQLTILLLELYVSKEQIEGHIFLENISFFLVFYGFYPKKNCPFSVFNPRVH